MSARNDFSKKVQDLFKEHGVGNYMFCFDDPDSDHTRYRKQGSLEWALGSLIGFRLWLDQELEESWKVIEGPFKKEDE